MIIIGAISSYATTPMLLSNYFGANNINNNNNNKRMICRRGYSVITASAGGGGTELFSVTSSDKSDVDYLGQSTRGDLNLKFGIISNPLPTNIS